MRLRGVGQLVCTGCAIAAAAAAGGCDLSSDAGDSPPDSLTCAEKGIHPLRGAGGSCVSGRNLYVVAMRAAPVRLADAVVTLEDVTVRPWIRRAGDGAGAPLLPLVPERDYFVLVKLRVANRLPRALDWRRRVVERAALLSGRRRYFERHEIETPASQRLIARRAVATRVLVFDVPAAAARKLDRAGSALFFAADNPTRYAATTIGVIRLSG